MGKEEKSSFTRTSSSGQTRGPFLFTGEISFLAFIPKIWFFSVAAALSLFFFAIPFLHSLILLGLIITLTSIVVRRLRDVGFHWAWVLTSLIPVAGWLLLAVLLSRDRSRPRNSKNGSGATEPTSRLLVRHLRAGVGAFVSFALLATSISLATASQTIRESTHGAVPVSESSLAERQAADAEQERLEQEQEAEAARIAEAAEREAAEDAERRAAEASQIEQAKVDETFESLIAQLIVEPEFTEGYQRSLFRHWVDANGNGCDTRREVLISESLTPVSVGPGCSLSGGIWYSVFDGITSTNPSDFDIDHFVPLAEAWRSGAHRWDSGTRQRFANDLDYEQSLIAVSKSSNRSKADRDPARWMPPNAGYKCEYVYSWVQIKIRWSLSVDSSELAALNSNWLGCSISSLNLSPTPGLAPISSIPPPAPLPETETSAGLTNPTPNIPPATAGCININTAPIEELQKIAHIGPARAAQLVSLRPFSNVDGLVSIDGISAGGVRLAEIKAQGLACVG